MKTLTTNIKDLPKDELIKFTPSSAPISKDGRQSILRLINPANLPKNFDYRPMAAQGSLVKRIKSFSYKNYGVKLSEEALGKLGLIIRESSIKAIEYNMDFTNSFNWQAGDFGDGESCFWQGRQSARLDMMATGTFSALRFFKRKILDRKRIFNTFYDMYNGISRSWIWKTTLSNRPTKDILTKTECYVLFNGYGMTTATQAAIFAAYTGFAYTKVDVTNKGHCHSGIWLNGDAFLFGPKDIIKNYKKLDFGVEEHYWNARQGRGEVPPPTAANDALTRLVMQAAGLANIQADMEAF